MPLPSAPAPFFVLLTDFDNYTSRLVATPPPWGRTLQDVPRSGNFMMSDWHDLPHVIVHRLSRHAARTKDVERATACVVASPVGRWQKENRGQCGGGRASGASVAHRLRQLGERHCPGRPLIVIDGADADGANTALCSALWTPSSCVLGVADPLVRVTGNAPGLQSEVATGLRRGLCRRLPAMPYLAHARSPLAARALPSARPLRIAYAAASWGHVDADKHGFVAWRKALRNECRRLQALAGARHCEWVWISMSGNGAEKAIQKYATADFCLQPPGDTLPRPGVIDAITTGCVPVLFHPQQRALWPAHWAHPNRSSVLFDFTGGAPRPRTRDPVAYAAQAAAALQTLIRMPQAELSGLQNAIAAQAHGLVYALREPRSAGWLPTSVAAAATARTATADKSAAQSGVLPDAATSPLMDAVDLLVEQMRSVQLSPGPMERARYSAQLREREEMLEAQRHYESHRRAARRAKQAGRGSSSSS